MNDLRKIYNEVIHSSDKWESYFDVYHRHLAHLRGQEITLVEIGVQKGGSLEMWSKYLGPQATIIGIDVDEECKNLKYEQENIEVVIGDQSSIGFWDNFLSEHPKIDILIDDGGHNMIQQMVTFYKVFPSVSVPGIYICEDCHTSYMNFFIQNNKTFIEHSKECIDVLNKKWFEGPRFDIEDKLYTAQNLTSLHFYDSIVVYEKLGVPNMERVCPNGFTVIE